MRGIGILKTQRRERFLIQILNLFEKRCTGCGEVKPLTEFYRAGGKRKGYRSKCRKCMGDYNKRYFQTERGKEVIARASRNYFDTEKGTEAHRRGSRKWGATEKGREYCNEYSRRYKTTKKGKLNSRRYYTKRRRKMGFNPLNGAFEGSVWHHVNDVDVVAIPESVHRRLGRSDAELHRKLILEYYGSLEAMIGKRE